MQKILVPTDFSDEAGYAVELAIRVAKKMNAEIFLLHVVEDSSVTSVSYTGEIDLPDMQDRLFIVKLIERAKAQLADTIAAHSDVNITQHLRVGNPYHNIKDIITEQQVDLVVMGTTGVSGINELLIGSNAEKVVRHAKCPVLTVKQSAEDYDFNDIVFATDLNKQDEVCVNAVKNFGKMFDAKIHMVRINTPNNFEADNISFPALKEYAEKYGFENYNAEVFNDFTEEDGIMHFAQSIDADMIAMATHGRTGFAHLLTGSIAEDVVNHARRPVLTYVLKK
ncbi:universal stress protein [Fulvivirga sp. M361]|uniref:universal stress protein n=1 Tax=Fulvivirga sp. M361 TaxID=2594266 RepID=UPI00117A2630|nr:universal stress protein [Fulvivirga sp. M361]TRX47144.1 universal stress protein [Fulvivirga sp. M361]